MQELPLTQRAARNFRLGWGNLKHSKTVISRIACWQCRARHGIHYEKPREAIRDRSASRGGKISRRGARILRACIGNDFTVNGPVSDYRFAGDYPVSRYASSLKISTRNGCPPSTKAAPATNKHWMHRASLSQPLSSSHFL